MSTGSRVSPGDPPYAGFERFVLEASPGLLRSAYLLTGDRAEAEDLLQVALMRTMRRWESITGSPAGYAFVALVHLSHDRRRRQRRRPWTVPETDALHVADTDPVQRLLQRDLVVRAAGLLSPTQRQVIACRFLLDLSVTETSSALQMPESTVRSHCARALARMRASLDGDHGASADRPTEVRDAE